MGQNTIKESVDTTHVLVRLGLAAGTAMYLAEVCRLTQNVDTFRLDWPVLFVLGLYLGAPLLAIFCGHFIARIRGLDPVRGGLFGLVALLFAMATVSTMIWVDGEATLLSRRWRFVIGMTPGIGMPILAAIIHRKWRPALPTWVYGSVVVWCLSIAGTRIFRDLALHLYNFRWLELAGGILHGLFLIGCALLCWLWLRLVVTHGKRALVVLLVVAGCIPAFLSNLGTSRDPGAVEPAREGNIFFIVLDSLRGDHTTPDLMPNLGELAERGVRFSDAHSPSINTTYSLPMLQARDLDSHHAIFRTRFNAEAPDFQGSLPGRLKEAGYEIHLLSDYAHTSLNALEIYRWDSVASLPTYRRFRLPALPASLLAFVRRDRAAMKKLQTGKYPFGPGGFAEVLDQRLSTARGPGFYLIHLAVPHAPYNVLPYRTQTLPSPSEEEMRAINDRFRLESGDNIDVEGRKKAYRLAVRAGDEQLGALLEAISKNTGSDKALIIVTSDHGEPFGEHSSVGHGRSLYNSAHHVPLVLAGPDYAGGRVAANPVSGSQLPATIFQWAGLEKSDRTLSLSPKSPKPLAIWHPRGTVIQQDNWRLIWTQAKHVLDRPKSWAHREEFELYDISKDPGELHNLFDSRPPALKPLLEILSSHWRIPEASRALAKSRRPE